MKKEKYWQCNVIFQFKQQGPISTQTMQIHIIQHNLKVLLVEIVIGTTFFNLGIMDCRHSHFWGSGIKSLGASDSDSNGDI